MPQPDTQTEYGHHILAIDSVDVGSLSITVKVQDDARLRTFPMHHLDADPALPVWRQLFEACVESLQLSDGRGDWTSWKSLESGIRNVGHVAARLVDAGITDLTSKTFNLTAAEAAIENTEKMGRPVLVRAVKLSGRPDADRLASNIEAIPNAPRERVNNGADYSDEQAEAVKEAASEVVLGWAERHKKMLEGLGFSTTGADARSWLDLTADEIIKAAKARDALRPEPVSGRARSLNARVAGLAALVYPHLSEFAAFAVLHCCHESHGFNAAQLLNLGANDLVHIGKKQVLINVAKARSHTKTHLAATWKSHTNSIDGVLSLLHARTELARHHRAHQLGPGHRLADKYYVTTRPDSKHSRVLSTTELSEYSSHVPQFAEVLQRVCDEQGLTRPTLQFRELRHYCLRKALPHDPDFTLSLHGPRSRQQYLTQCLPNTQFHTLTTATQQRMADVGSEELVTAFEAGTAINMGFNVCTSGRLTPDVDEPEPEQFCQYTLSACLVCPNGYRTADSIPGLLAAVAYCDDLLSQGVVTDNELRRLRHYAQLALDQYPPTQVAAVKAALTTDEWADRLLFIDDLHNEPRSAPDAI